MITIMLTGNYNFFNILYMALCLALMDDTWLDVGKEDKANGGNFVKAQVTT